MARDTASKAVCALIEAAVRVTPSGKQNSFAAHQLPALLWIEIRDRNLPVSYANAFCTPVNPKTVNGVEKESALNLKAECEKLTRLFNLEARDRLLLAKDSDLQILDTKTSSSLKEILETVEAAIKSV